MKLRLLASVALALLTAANGVKSEPVSIRGVIQAVSEEVAGVDKVPASKDESTKDELPSLDQGHGIAPSKDAPLVGTGRNKHGFAGRPCTGSRCRASVPNRDRDPDSRRRQYDRSRARRRRYESGYYYDDYYYPNSGEDYDRDVDSFDGLSEDAQLVGRNAHGFAGRRCTGSRCRASVPNRDRDPDSRRRRYDRTRERRRRYERNVRRRRDYWDDNIQRRRDYWDDNIQRPPLDDYYYPNSGEDDDRDMDSPYGLSEDAQLE